MFLFTIFFFNFIFGQSLSQVESESPWTWTCRNQTCVKLDRDEVKEDEIGVDLPVCKLNCGEYGTLWPKPTGKVEISPETVCFDYENIKFEYIVWDPKVEELLGKGTEIFKGYLKMQQNENEALKNSSDVTLSIKLIVNWGDSPVRLGYDEGYFLTMQLQDDQANIDIRINANTYYGARHGLETLSQLIAFDEAEKCHKIVTRATITDKPSFSYRGILIDVSRNYFSVESLQRLIEGMSYNKLNVLHLHLTDTHSFPFQSKRVPQLSQYGAYHSTKIYTPQALASLVEYGKVRGVKILPELDAPSHTGAGWNFGPKEGKGNLALCINKEPWRDFCVEPPCGQLNPTNEAMYNYLGDIYKDLLDIFDNDVFHQGGDEVNVNCWKSEEEVTKWMVEKGYTLDHDGFLQVWDYFQQKAYDKLKEANDGKHIDSIVWTSDMANEKNILKYLNASNYIVQIWTAKSDPVIPFLVKNNYRVIFSNYDSWYFDCGFGPWVGKDPNANNWCSPYKGWQNVYENSPMKILNDSLSEDEMRVAVDKGLVLGGEVALWTEQADEHSMDSKIWPRASAFAERMWTNPETFWTEAENRMIHNRQRYVERNLRPNRLQPEYCHQNENLCY